MCSNFSTSKVSVDAFSLLYSKLLNVKVCLFLVGAFCGAYQLQFIINCSCLNFASVGKLSRARGGDTRTGDFKSPGRRIESATAKVLIFKAYFFKNFS